MRPIDADALIDDLMERYCKECDKRKGIKNGKRQFIYAIGDAPCRACEVDDVKAELEEAPAIDAVPVVRCKDCRWKEREQPGMVYCPATVGGWVDENWFCKGGERN
jgi:hypothetical protein